ncbi:MAG TPA: DNA repair protein [Xanthobacteraceae bacterium]|nr:DNA repair protein [Xanthobacteraceae bacterium]
MVVVRLSSRAAFLPPSGIVSALKRAIRSIETDTDRDGRAAIPLGVSSIDEALGGGLACAAFHEIAAARESAMAAASGFALALAAGAKDSRAVVWIAEDMGRIENGAPYGPGLDDFGLASERLVTVATAQSRDVLWAMEEALRCRAVGAVVGEIRNTDRVDLLASRRLSLAAGRSDACAFLLGTAPGTQPSAAATRWVVAAASSMASVAGPGPPRLSVHLTRNRRGPVGSWLLEFNRAERRFDLAPSLSQPVADAACDRPHRAAAVGA